MTTTSTRARALSALLGFAAATVVEQGARMAALRGSSGVVAVVVFFCGVVVASVVGARLRVRRTGPALIAVGGVVVCCEGVIGSVFAPVLGASAVAVVVGRAVAAVPWTLLPGLGLGLRRPPSLSAALFGAAASTLLQAWASPVVVVVVAALAALAVVADDDAGEGADVTAGVGVVIAAAVFVVVAVHAGDASFGDSVCARATVRAVFFVGMAIPLWSTWSSSTALSTSAAALSLLWLGATLGWAPALLLWPPRPESFLGLEIGRAIVVVVVTAPAALGVGALVAAGGRVVGAAGIAVGVVVGTVAGIGGVDVIGGQPTLFAIALLLAVVAIALGWTGGERLAIASAGGAVMVMVLLLPPWPPLTWSSGTPSLFQPRRADKNARLISFDEDVGSVVVVARRRASKKRHRKSELVVLENGNTRAITNDRATEERVAQQALAGAPSATRGLVLGSGSGAGVAVLRARLRQVDVVDGSAALTAAAAKTWRADASDNNNDNSTDDIPHASVVRTHGDTLRGGLARSDVVDLVVVAARPWTSAEAADLTSAGFYRQARARLSDDGVLLQRISRRTITARELESVVDNARAVFADVATDSAGAQLLLIARGRHDEARGAVVDGAGDLARTLGRRVPRHVVEGRAPAR